MAGVSNGLNKIKGFDSVTVQDKLEIEYFSTKQGLTTSDFAPNSSFIDDDNSIWVGQPNGLLHLYLKRMFPIKYLLCFILEEIKLGMNLKNLGKSNQVRSMLWYWKKILFFILTKTISLLF